MVDWRYPDDGA